MECDERNTNVQRVANYSVVSRMICRILHTMKNSYTFYGLFYFVK